MVTTRYVVRSQNKKFGYFQTQEEAEAAISKIKKRNPKIKQLTIWPETGNWHTDHRNNSTIYDDFLK